MAELLLGPIVRYVDSTSATIWVETDQSTVVSILGRRVESFCVERHHYGLVVIDDLEPGTDYSYKVELDGRRVWPLEANPPSYIRTLNNHGAVKIILGSCRAAAPHKPPYSLPRSAAKEGREVDALYAYALQMMRRGPSEWPHVLLMLGDQVYVDESFPETRKFINARRDTNVPPGEEVVDFEEYAHLYYETWGDPVVRWLLSTVSVSMIFDDHDIADDWNISESWVADMRKQPWWQDRIEAGLMTYWLYQHVGNLSPRELDRNELLKQIRETSDGGPVLRAYARRSDRGLEATDNRFSYSRDLGRARLLMIDVRCGRILEDGRRGMIDDGEWAWIQDRLDGDFDHLLIGTSLPLLLPRGIHDFEAWSEAICTGRWGRAAAWVGERLRRAVDLEHWAAFGSSFERLVRLIEEIGCGRICEPPATITILSGDVHYSYVARATFPGPMRSPVHQAVCSPLRNPVGPVVHRGFRFAQSRAGAAVGRMLARSVGLRPPRLEWSIIDGPWFHNDIATLTLDHSSAVAHFDRSLPSPPDSPTLETVCERELST
jgi:hypothetical protein